MLCLHVHVAKAIGKQSHERKTQQSKQEHLKLNLMIYKKAHASIHDLAAKYDGNINNS